MELLCPECMGTLVSADGNTVRCSVHGGQYRVLFSRNSLAPVAMPLPASEPAEPPPALAAADVPAGMCANHSNLRAAFACAICGKQVCTLCAFAREDGSRLCPDCASATMPAVPPPVIDALTYEAEVNVQGLKCLQHPNVAAIRACKVCGAPMCNTCDFLLPGNIHLCPRCVVAPPKRISGGRKKLVIGGYALAAWSTLAMVALVSGVLAGLGEGKKGEELIGVIYSLFIFVPSLAGTGLSIACLDRRLQNPGYVWGAIIWNGLLLLINVILVIIGNFTS